MDIANRGIDRKPRVGTYDGFRKIILSPYKTFVQSSTPLPSWVE